MNSYDEVAISQAKTALAGAKTAEVLAASSARIDAGQLEPFIAATPASSEGVLEDIKNGNKRGFCSVSGAVDVLDGLGGIAVMTFASVEAVSFGAAGLVVLPTTGVGAAAAGTGVYFGVNSVMSCVQ